MRRLGLLIVLLAIVGIVGLAFGTGPVAAEEHEFPPHPHILLQRLEIEFGEGVVHVLGVRQCVDLAGNRSVPLHAHHERLHFGTSGVSFMGGESGHVVFPTAPFPMVPWNNCAEFEAMLPFSVPTE